MKPKMMSKRSLDYLFYHILDGFRSSHEGIVQLEKDSTLTDEEIHDLVKKNAERLIERIREFRLTEKLTCLFFAVMFGWMQVSNDELEMRRPARVRARTSTARSRTGRKKNETEL